MADPASSTESSTPPNPLANSPTWYIYAKAYALRYAASFGIGYYNRIAPAAPVPTKTIHLDSTLGEYKGTAQIPTEVWVPSKPTTGLRPAVINFHGGGFILGYGVDDARFMGEVMESLDAVGFTVNYRLAPGYPYPTPIEDCVDAILQITARAEEFGVDPSRIILSGFSAGGNCALASWTVLQDPAQWNYTFATEPPAIVGLVLFYPVLDWTISRVVKREASARPDLALQPYLTDLIDISYFNPPLPHANRTDLRVSPALMPDAIAKKLPPIHQCLCEYDMLLQEGQAFTKRLQQLDKPVTERLVKEAVHAWDKPPPMEYKKTAQEEYAAAIESIADWLGIDYKADE
ncbi:hypothetical protein VHEMI00522 [[Torrubiella] hemipterigena]|uniref:Alpha/beta hydrolase fold-3 domain-containing protein n=1 Tax=[Torrubiella] hemipterigena TaxID=1531966 RepID=A0A0A1SJG7_9HYPO|nr:hypothetical protein VHEMI00522 [[Torrubiella] hemipterigena]